MDIEKNMDNFSEGVGSPATNHISLFGEIATDLTFSHDSFGEGFYAFDISVPRLSQTYDLLPVIISERLLEGSKFVKNEIIEIEGQIRSYNNYIEEEARNRLVLTVFTKDYNFCEEPTKPSPNEVFLDGFICKPPIYRTTPFGREIADVLLAVNRSYNKSDYIPCIAWGRNARFVSKLSVGDNIKIWGRMQSRLYQKKLDNEELVEKTAFEVSVSRIESKS
ncbi:MAG: single-stranded DNA-binding protein [Defluviitaleaceae bacterium]|nr:single-stranded DNA-binding protein [Defluviitaleaceae bacterium]